MKHRIKIICLILLLVVAAAPYGAGDEVKKPFHVTAKVKNEQINIGDRIKLDVIAENPAGLEILFPETPEELGDFSFIRSRPIRSGKWGAPRQEGREYVLSIYDTGTHVVPPIKVMYKNPDEDQWHVTESPQVPIEVMSVLTGEEKDIRDLKELVVFGIGRFWMIFLGAALLAVFIAAVWMLWRRKVKRAANESARIRFPHEIAYKQLKQLKKMDLPGQGRVKEYYTILSGIVRQYLESRFSLRAPEMTTEEFMKAAGKSPKIVDKHKKLLKDFLFHCDMVKFAKYGPTLLEMLDIFREAENFIDQTRLMEEEGEDRDG